MFNKNAQNSRVEAVDAKTSTAYQGMYADISFSRTIEKIENNIVISDTIGEKNLSTKLCTNWIIPASWKIIRSKGIITFSHETGITWNMYYAEEDYNLIEEDKVFVSPLKNTKVPASRLKFFPNKTITTIRVELWK